MVSIATPISREIAAGTAEPGGAEGSINVGDLERWLSLAGGGWALLQGFNRGSLLLAGLGGALVYRGLSGCCPMYSTLGVSTSRPHSDIASVAAGKGFKVVTAMTIQRPVEELYQVWRDFENLPRFMSHLESITVDGRRSHWVAHGPAGTRVHWDAEIINEEANRLIAWRSLKGSQVSTAGSVHFQPAPAEGGTEVIVTLKYDPPGGKLGGWLAWLFGEEPRLQIEDDLRRFKQLMETSELAAAVNK